MVELSPCPVTLGAATRNLVPEVRAMPQRGEFRATTDTMLDIIDQLRAAEERKQQVEVGSDEFLLTAKKAEDLSRLAYRWASMQLAMALDTQFRISNGELDGETRLSTVTPRPLDRVLANWREAQFRLEIRSPRLTRSPRTAAREIERLRDEYQARTRGQDGRSSSAADSLARARRRHGAAAPWSVTASWTQGVALATPRPRLATAVPLARCQAQRRD